jgi:hypothetical protein
MQGMYFEGRRSSVESDVIPTERRRREWRDLHFVELWEVQIPFDSLRSLRAGSPLRDGFAVASVGMTFLRPTSYVRRRLPRCARGMWPPGGVA